MVKQKSSWEDVDTSKNSQHYIHLLDTEKRQPSVQQYVELGYKLLDLKEGSSVIDIGCGVGNDAINLCKMVGATGRVVAIDYSQKFVEIAQNRAAEAGAAVEFYVGDAHDLSLFADNTFDAARTAAMFHHLTHPQKAVQEMHRIIKPGGTIVCLEGDSETLVIDHPQKALTRQIINYHCDRQQQNGWVGRQLPRLFKQVGLDVSVIAISTIFTDYVLLDLFFGLEKVVQHMQTAGDISAAAGQQWLTTLKEYDAQKLLFASITGFIVKGRKLVSASAGTRGVDEH